MKKLFLGAAFALFGAVAVNAQQGFNLGAHVGLPMGDAKDTTSFTLGLDASYLWPVGTDFYAGIGTGYQAWLGKDYTYSIPGMGTYTVKATTVNVVPLVATALYKVAPNFGLGLDLGYGLMFANGNNDGAFYYQPKVSYIMGNNGNVWLGYEGMSKNGSSVSSLNLGYSYSFGK
ncbi:MAG: hypothetical protein IAE62_00950 [Flavobacteriales bacterium]|jgi:hypothetical protein|nr:hypothetical protein [Flavobacteriales bacterium]HCN12512.1 hypothetical protein [Chryseobacterium sp.]